MTWERWNGRMDKKNFSAKRKDDRKNNPNINKKFEFERKKRKTHSDEKNKSYLSKNNNKDFFNNEKSFSKDKDINLDYVYGINAVKEALVGERTINSILVASGNRSRSVYEIISKAKDKKIPVKEVGPEKLKQLLGTERNQGIAAYMSAFPYYSLDDAVNDENNKIIIALDEITDVHNLGAVLRTVEACGLKYVIIPERRSAQLNSTVSKTSAGAVEHVKVVRVTSLTNALKTLQKEGYWVFGADMEGSIDYRDADYSGKIVLVIGSESCGLRESTKKLCDFKISIPMYGKINSLNASVSASILMYEIIRK